jgi:hypothetical protein
MTKPQRATGYEARVTDACERVLVTLLRNLGPWKKSIFLIGGLTPRYLVPDRPPKVPPHAGTGDVDVVVELAILEDTEAYHSLEENLMKLGFERAENSKGNKVSWRWRIRPKDGPTVILELLADNPDLSGGKVRELPTEGNISALNIPHSSMVFDHHRALEVETELLDEGGVAKEIVRHADIVSFTSLKAFAFDDRNEPKDAHDLIYCLEFGEGGPEHAAKQFVAALDGKHRDAIAAAVDIVKRHFADDTTTEGYRKNGPVAVAKFEFGDEEETRDDRTLRQRQAADIVMSFLMMLR